MLIFSTGCTSLEPVTWQLDDTVDTSSVWDTNRDANATVLSLNCVSTFGPNHLLTGLQGFKERGSNLDRFIASLNIDCAEYIEFGGKYIRRPVDPSTSTITTHLTFRTNAGEQPISLESAQYPIGFVIGHNNQNHIMNLQILYVEEVNGILSDYVDPEYTPPTITDYPAAPDYGLLGTRPDVSRRICGSQEVLTGIRIRPDPQNGKIRMIGLDCQLLHRDESAQPEEN